MIDKKMIDEAFDFYNIDHKYLLKCYKTLDIINKNEEFRKAYKRVNKILFEGDFNSISALWNIKDIDKLFCDNIEPFITNLLILSGYEVHKRNMEKYKLDHNQIRIHKMRVKECFEEDLISRNHNGVRISKMLWATYFIRIKLIEVGSLQFEYKDNFNIKIHIPKNTDFDILKVKASIESSKIELKKIYHIDNCKYICNSWLLSNQLYAIIDKDSNIAKFHNLFSVRNGEECTDDLLNYVYEMDKCDNFSTLPINTSLQKKVKENLLYGQTFYLGLGVLKQESNVKENN